MYMPIDICHKHVSLLFNAKLCALYTQHASSKLYPKNDTDMLILN